MFRKKHYEKPNSETVAFLATQYKKLSFNIAELSMITGLGKQHIYNQISRKEFAIPTYREGGRRFADIRDVASYLDSRRKIAS
jgi:predicted DNA-binding transcriptional regulator AlpA